MDDTSQSGLAQSQSVVSQSEYYRNKQKNLQLTANDWQRILREGGVQAVLAKKREIDDEWKKLPVLIAVVGQTGSGKSTLIRRLLGYQPNDSRGPAIGRSVKECTKTATEYRKEGTGLVYVDLPGIGSINTTCAFNTTKQQEDYCQRFRLDTIDYFLLISQNKFNDQEKLLAKYIKNNLKKKFIFVQTKIDTLRAEYGNQIIEENEGFDAVKNIIRTDIRSQLSDEKAERIFLISNRAFKVELNGQQRWIYDNSQDYEFDLLVKQIQDDMLGEGGLTALKGEAFILATDAISKSAIQAKANALRNQSWGWSTLSAVIGAVPIPGFSLICDSAIVLTQGRNYFHAFGLNPAHYIGEGTPIEKVKHLINVTGASMGLRHVALRATAVGVSLLEEAAKVVPVIGSVLGSGISFSSTCILLRQLIDFCEKEALKVIQQT